MVELEKQNIELQEKLAEAEAHIESIKNLYVRMEPSEQSKGETTAYAIMIGTCRIGTIYKQPNRSNHWFGRVNLDQGIDLGVYGGHTSATSVMNELVRRLS
jgi:hypothetical protein